VRTSPLKRFALILNHLTMSLCLLAKHALRRGLIDHKRSITTSSGLKNMAFGGPNPAIGVVAALARYTVSRYAPRLAE